MGDRTGGGGQVRPSVPDSYIARRELLTAHELGAQGGREFRHQQEWRACREEGDDDIW